MTHGNSLRFWNWPRASHLFPVVKFKMLRFGFFGGTRNRNKIDLNFLGHLLGGDSVPVNAWVS